MPRKNVVRQGMFYAEAQVRKYEHAVSLSGIRAVVYSVKKGGTPCTCLPSATILDADGNMSAEGMEEIGRTVQGAWGGNKGHEYEAANLDIEIDRLDTDGKISAGNVPLDEADFHSDDLAWEEAPADPFSGFGQTRCGVCFGTGYVGGYDVGNGQRTVLDVQSRMLSMDGASISSSGNPGRFELDGSAAKLSFAGKFPVRRASRVSMFRVWDNDMPLPREGFEWTNKTEFVSGVRRKIDLDVFSDFTHVEVQFTNGDSHVDMGQPEERFDAVLAGQHATASFNVPAFAAVNASGIIRESKYNRAWQVVSVSSHRSAGTTVFHEAEARLVAQHELFHLLPGAGA